MLSNEIDIGAEKKDRDHHPRCRTRVALMDGVDSRRVIARCKERLTTPSTALTHARAPRRQTLGLIPGQSPTWGTGREQPALQTAHGADGWSARGADGWRGQPPRDRALQGAPAAHHPQR
jgi:hypothetical protein